MKKLAAAVALLAFGACSDPGTLYGTAIYLDIEFTRAIDQVSVSLRGGDGVLGPVVRPTPAATVLTSPQTLRLLLPEESEPRAVTVAVDGLSATTVVSRGVTQLELVPGFERRATITLSDVAAGAGGGSGGTAGGSAGIGGGRAGGTGGGAAGGGAAGGGAALDSGTVDAGLDHGLDGGADAGTICDTCDPIGADGCTVDAGCGCGSGPACAQGQACLSGVCVCTAASCPHGCCRSGACLPPSVMACGSNCTTCSPTSADSCLRTGQCGCGLAASCGVGQRCAGGACVCDQASCASGCCSGATCNTGLASNCGTGGGACAACDPLKANACANGGCRCGASPACGAGQRCQGGACVCNATTGCAGCCAGAVCLPGTSDLACGKSGDVCSNCAAAHHDQCSHGKCT